MNRRVLGIGDLGVASKPETTLVTYALGSCVAVVLRCRWSQAVGMVHVALPTGTLSAEKGEGYFADTGVPALLREMELIGAQRTGLSAVLVGGASMVDGLDRFVIGKRNVLATRKALWRLGLGAVAEDVEGVISRTVSVTVGVPGVQVSNHSLGTWTV